MTENSQAWLSRSKLCAFLMNPLTQLAVWIHGKTKETLTNSKAFTELSSLPLHTPSTTLHGTLFSVSVFPTMMATVTANSNPAFPAFSVMKESFPQRNLSLSPVSTLYTERTFPSPLCTTTENFNHAKSAKKFKKTAMLDPHSSPTSYGSPVSVCITATESSHQPESTLTFSTIFEDTARNEASARRITEDMQAMEHAQMMRTLSTVLYKRDMTRARILDLALSEAANFLKNGKGNDHSLRWSVVKLLRANDYHVGLCKAITNNVGDQEYIDVLMPQQRYIVDMVFKERFQIARPSPSYLQLFQKLPTVFVGSFEEISMVVQIMCRTIEISMEGIGLESPPYWRQFHYIMATWTASYKREIVPPPGFEGAETS